MIYIYELRILHTHPSVSHLSNVSNSGFSYPSIKAILRNTVKRSPLFLDLPIQIRKEIISESFASIIEPQFLVNLRNLRQIILV